MALPSEPRKGPKAPAAELPSRGSRSLSKYMNRIWGRIGGYNVGWQRPCMHAILSNPPFSNPFLEEKGIRSFLNRGDIKLPRLLSVPSPCSTFYAGGPMPRTGSVPLSYIAWRSLSTQMSSHHEAAPPSKMDHSFRSTISISSPSRRSSSSFSAPPPLQIGIQVCSRGPSSTSAFLHRTPPPRKGVEIKHEPLRAGSS